MDLEIRLVGAAFTFFISGFALGGLVFGLVGEDQGIIKGIVMVETDPAKARERIQNHYSSEIKALERAGWTVLRKAATNKE